MSKKIILTESQIVNRIIEFISNECDADELARLCGEIFGGECFRSDEIEDETYDFIYEFKVDENYYGAFDNITNDGISSNDDDK